MLIAAAPNLKDDIAGNADKNQQKRKVIRKVKAMYREHYKHTEKEKTENTYKISDA